MKKNKRLIRKILTFIGSFVTAASVLAQFFPSFFSISENVSGVNRCVLIFVVILLISLFFMNWKQNQDEIDEKFYSEHNATHRYAHLIRDTVFESKKLCNNTKNNSLAKHLIKNFSEGVVKCIYDSLYEYMGIDKSKNELDVCIKILDFQYWDNSNIVDKTQVTYRTISRAIVPRGALQADDAVSHKIEQSTAFYKVFCMGKHDWIGVNLDKKDNIQIVSEDIVEKGEYYLDTCNNWREHYISKIVIPIRVKLSEIDDMYINSDKRNLFGFLCVECKKRNLFKFYNKFDKDLISICDYLKTYADSMYVVFDDIYQVMN